MGAGVNIDDAMERTKLEEQIQAEMHATIRLLMEAVADAGYKPQEARAVWPSFSTLMAGLPSTKHVPQAMASAWVAQELARLNPPLTRRQRYERKRKRRGSRVSPETVALVKAFLRAEPCTVRKVASLTGLDGSTVREALKLCGAVSLGRVPRHDGRQGREPTLWWLGPPSNDVA